MRSPAPQTSCNPSVGAGVLDGTTSFFRTRQGTRALPYKVLRYRGRADRVVRPYKPFRRAGCPHPAAGLAPHSLAKTLSLRTSDRFTGVAIRSPRPWYRGITDSHDQSADWSRNDTQILSTSVTAVAIRPPSPKMLFPSRKKGTPPPGRAPFQTDSIHQKSALPTVRGCSSTSRMLLTPVRYMTIRSKPRPKPACLQVP